MIKWLYNHYALSGMIVLYYMVLLGYGTLQVFGNLDQITAPVASVYLALIGLPPAGIALLMGRLAMKNED